MFVAGTVDGRTIFVDADANGTNDGSSWENAYSYLQDALADANTSGDINEIRAAQGIYIPDQNSADPNGSGDRMATFQLINGVALRGGYSGFGEPDPNTRDIELYETILSGDLEGNDVVQLRDPSRDENSYHVVTGSSTDETAIMEGFTISGGNANGPGLHTWGAGMYNDGGNPTLTNCTFSGNIAIGWDGGGDDAIGGGGMYNSGNPTLTDCVFANNEAYAYGSSNGFTGRQANGGGIYTSGNPILTNCTFIGNRANAGFWGMSGLTAWGGAMYNSGDPVMENCIFSNNTVSGAGNGYGGGIYTTGNPVLTNCTLSENEADGADFDGNGGGICNDSGSPTLTDCILSGNTAQGIYAYGGGMHNSGSANLTGCTFLQNRALGWRLAGCGGGMYNSADSTLVNCKFLGNTAEGKSGCKGGGIYNLGNPRLTGCTLIENMVVSFGDSLGGGMYNSGDPTLMNCELTRNAVEGAWSYGGGVYNSGHSVLRNCTLSVNVAGMIDYDGYGGGIYNDNGNATLTNCIVWGNTSISDVQQIFGDASVTYSDVQGGWPGIGNIADNPCFADSCNGDYHLLPKSLCIDMGDNNSVPSEITTDLDGKPRIIGGIVDMGAYEFAAFYVDDNSPNDPGTGTRDDPFRRIQDAIDTAQKGYFILVAEGTYNESLRIEDSNALYETQLDEAITFSAQQLTTTVGEIGPSEYPYSTLQSYLVWWNRSSTMWTSGFFPGCLWTMYELTNDPCYLQWAQMWTADLEGEAQSFDTQDLGFIIFNTFGPWYRHTGNEHYKNVILQAAQTVSTLYSPTVGLISANWGPWDFPVNIDSMMAVELLFWASDNGGSSSYRQIAIDQARHIIDYYIRPDGSSHHFAEFDSTSGDFIRYLDGGGYSVDTTWSRGQAWGIYGFTVAYRETGDIEFLDAAQSLADYYVENLPADYVPYWDFQAPGIPDTERDSSAAAIAASALLELSTLTNDSVRKEKYRLCARRTINSLSLPYEIGGYLAVDSNGIPISKGILMEGCQNHNNICDESLIWGDYYFLEALLRYGSLNSAVATKDIYLFGGYNRNDWSEPRDPNLNETVIDANDLYESAVYISDVNVTIDGFKITNGYAQNGGGIYCEGATLIVRNCVITGNQTVDGVMGDPNLNGTDGGDGGGIYSIDSTASIENSIITENTAGHGGNGQNGPQGLAGGDGGNGGKGGGVYFSGPYLSVSNCMVALNMSGNGGSGGDGGFGGGNEWKGGEGGNGGLGGGICCATNSFKIRNSVITGNMSGHGGCGGFAGGDGGGGGPGGDGGGIWYDGTSMVVVNTSVTDNIAGFGGCGGGPSSLGGNGGSGGGIRCSSGSVILNCVFGGNAAGDCGAGDSYGGDGDGGHGGGIWGPARIANCVVAGNIAGDSGSGGAQTDGDGGNGGGVFQPSRVEGCTIVGNKAGVSHYDGTDGQGSGIYADSNTLISNSILCNNSPDQLAGHDCSNVTYSNICDGTCCGQNGNICEDPLFVDSNGPDGDPNTWEDNDYHLSSYSPCIDAGDPNSALGDEPQPNGGRINMGAYGGTTEASLSFGSFRTTCGYMPGWPTTIRTEVKPAPSIAVYALEDAPPEGWQVSVINEGGVWDNITKKVKWGPFFDSNPRTLTYELNPPLDANGCYQFSGNVSFDGLSQSIYGDNEICEGPLHSADLDMDWCIVMDEITGYGACWKTGCTWPIGPNPIPIGYVTRAGYLWKSGECYHLDPNYCNDPPMCWQPNGGLSVLALAEDDFNEHTSYSFTPPHYAAASPFIVYIEVTPDPSTQAYAVEDTPPSSWIASNINEGGIWDAVNEKVKWGPFFDSNRRLLHYEVTPASGDSGIKTLSGTASFDGTDEPIARDITDMIGDFSIDGKVDRIDLAMLCNNWLQDHWLLDISPPPIGDNIINLLDFAKFARHWLEGAE
jgi:unsaturated chondroitin disaccharide hydrolase